MHVNNNVNSNKINTTTTTHNNTDTNNHHHNHNISIIDKITNTVSFQISNLFLRPRPWQFEIRDSTGKYATYLLSGFETLNLKFRDLKL